MSTKEALLTAIDQLPEQQLIEVLEYVQHLTQIQPSPAVNAPTHLNHPLSEFVGAVSHGSLATRIDRDLYGG